MADSKNNGKNPDKGSIGDLDDTKKSDERQNELIDDEDAIERLLMDNAFDGLGDDQEDEFAEIDELISERFDSSTFPLDDTETDEVDNLIASAVSEPDSEAADELIDIDEFGDDEFADDEFAEDDSQTRQDASLMPDFDISAEEADDEIVMDEIREEQLEASSEHASVQAADKTQDHSRIIAETTAALTAISTQLAELQNEQHVIKQKLETIESKDSSTGIIDDIDGLNSEQKKFQRRLTAIEQQKPIITYVALGVAIVAFLIAGGLGIVALSADSKVSELSENFVNLEEQVDAWMAKSKSENGLENVNTRLDRMDMEVANFSARISELNKKLETTGGQGELQKVSEQLDQLNERNVQTASVLEALEQKVLVLEKQRNSVSKKAVKKTPVVKEEWKVNLVSFKQEWYAKRKAAEFEKRGVPAEVMSVMIKGETWYRLRVKGFASKYEAAAYAAKVKKSLNLPSVWVTKD